MEDLLIRYNYESFVPDKFEQWLNFDASPKTGETAPDFPLWLLDGTPTRLSEILTQNSYTLLEFGSFT
jgi:hypothetical protein